MSQYNILITLKYAINCSRLCIQNKNRTQSTVTLTWMTEQIHVTVATVNNPHNLPFTLVLLILEGFAATHFLVDD